MREFGRRGEPVPFSDLIRFGIIKDRDQIADATAEASTCVESHPEMLRAHSLEHRYLFSLGERTTDRFLEWDSNPGVDTSLH